MVPDAGFADAVFGDAVIAPIPGMDLSLEMQHLYLEVEKRGAFNREVSIIRAKVQRWISKGEISGVEERARVIYGAILDAAQVEGLTGEWVRFLGKYLAKQATASARSSGVEWHLDRHEDLKKALELFLGEKVDSADDGGGTDGGGSGNKNMIDWNKLDLVLGAPWSRPTAELPYEIFKQKVVDSIAIYHLKGEPELYYLLRNFSGPLRDDINVMIREKLSEGLSSSDIVMRVWEYLDDRFSGTFNKGEALLRWERLAQKEDERVEDYFVRIDKESSLLCSVFGKQHLELEKCVRARMGLLPKLSKAIESLGKVVDRMSYKELRGEAMHFESQLSSGKNRWEAKSSPDLAPKRAAAGKGKSAVSSFTGSCSRCLQPGHSWRYCRSEKPGDMAQRCPRCGLRHRLADCAISPTVRCRRCSQQGHLQYVCPSPLISAQRPQGTDRASSTGKGGSSKRAPAYTIEVGCTSQSKASTSDATTGATQGARSSSDPLSCVVDLTCVEQNFTGAENEVLKESWSLKMMTGPDTVSLRIGNLDVCALVDSGAAVAMVRAELASRLHQEGIIERRKIKPVIITCANHTSRTVDEECILQVSLSRGSEGRASFYIPALVVKDLSYPIILGRVALRIVGAKLLYSLEDDEASKIQSSLKEEIVERPSPTQYVEERGAPSLDVPVIDIAQIEVSCSEEEECVKNLEDDIIREEEPQSVNLPLRGSIRTTLEEQVEKLLVDIPPEADFYATALSRIHDHGPFPLPNALEYTVQLKTLEELEHEEGHDAAVPDIPQQQYRFYIDWPEKVEKKRELERDDDVRGSWRPTGLIQRLSNEEYEKWQEELSMYFNRHWWVDTGIPVPNKESSTQFATCFPVVSLRKVTTPVRPCLDCRVINRQYPSAHNRRNSTHCAIQQLQGLLQPAWRVEQMDLSKAYYRLAIGRDLLIDCGDMTLKMTRRLAFGLSSGPASLEGVIDILFTVLRYKHPHIRTVRIMDDFLILSRNEEERQAWNADMFQLFAKCGFEIPDSKRSMWEEDSPQKWLGVKWKWDSVKGNLFVNRPEIKINGSIETKRGYFANAGKFLELTKSSAEAQCRGHCDIVRQLSGRAENSWDGILPKDVRDKCDLHLKAAEDLWQQIDQRVPLISGVKTVRLFTDASSKGYGIEFWAPARELYGAFRSREGEGEEEREDWVSIYGEAHLFPDRAEAWHANRREMFAILQSLTALCQQFERNWWRSLLTIVLGSDSFTAIRRMGGPERKLKGIEWLATRRIRDCTDDIIAELKTMSISVSFIHHPNTSFFTKRVDILSRIIDDIPFSRELLSIHASRDVPLTAIDLTVAIDDSKVPLLAFEVFDLYYPHSLLLPTLENVPSLRTYYDLDKTFHAWKGDSATPKHELRRRFLIREQEKDPLCSEVRHLLEEGADLSKKKRSVAPAVVYYGENAFLHNDVLCKKDPVDDEDDVRIVLPKSKYSRLPVELIKYYHDLRGHPAVNSTHRYLRRLFWWPRSRADVKSIIRSCHPCQVSASFLKRQHEAHLWTPSEPFEVLGLDIVGPLLPSSKGERWVLTCTDLLSRFTLLFPLADISTNTICRVIETQVLLRFGTPSTFISDQGRQFTLSPRFDALCCLYSARHIVLPVAHPASGGFYERQHRTIGDSLRRLLKSRQRASWVDLLSIAEGRLNSVPDPELGISPHEILFGFKLRLPFDVSLRSQVLQEPLTHDNIVSFISYPNKIRTSAVLSEVSRLDRHRRQLLNVWSDAWTRSRERSKGPEVREHYVRGESVYIYRKPQHKLDSQWIRGTIMNPIGGQCYEVQLSDGTRQVFHKDHIKPFYISEEEDRVPTPTSRGHKRRDLSSPPTTEGLPPKRRVRIVSSGHPFLAWKDEDGTVRVGSKISWTNDNFFLVHEYKLLEDHRTVVPMYFTPDGILKVGGPPEIPATVAVNPKGVSVLKLESPTQLSVESSRKVSAL